MSERNQKPNQRSILKHGTQSVPGEGALVDSEKLARIRRIVMAYWGGYPPGAALRDITNILEGREDARAVAVVDNSA